MSIAPPSPDVSLVMPCYNEEENVGYTIPRLVEAFQKGGHRLQIVAVNNGSRDRTGELLAELAARYPEVTPVTVEVNQGFGFGVLSGIPHAAAPYIGMVAADGQVDAEDVVRLYDAVRTSKTPVVGKVRRRFRMDGPLRKVISVSYNLFVHLLWPKLGSWDVNGHPRMFRRDVLLSMNLQSTNWFIDAETLIKAHYMGVRVFEVNVFARMRGNGLSHVRASTCLEFVRMLLHYRFSPELAEWRRLRVDPALLAAPQAGRGSA
jgi:glycosyltransferase involved in cell wall biosynthesis